MMAVFAHGYSCHIRSRGKCRQFPLCLMHIDRKQYPPTHHELPLYFSEKKLTDRGNKHGGGRQNSNTWARVEA